MHPQRLIQGPVWADTGVVIGSMSWHRSKGFVRQGALTLLKNSSMLGVKKLPVMKEKRRDNCR